MENITEVYIRAVENLTERFNSIRCSENIKLNQFIKQDIIKLEELANEMIRKWKEGIVYPDISNESLLDILTLYKKDLEETEDRVKKEIGAINLELSSSKSEMESVDAAIRKISALLRE